MFLLYCIVVKATFPLPIRSSRPSRSPKFPDQARPVNLWSFTLAYVVAIIQ